MDKTKSLYNQIHHISSLNDLPKTAHFAVIQQNSYSYQDPYPDTNFGTITENKLEYIAFDSEAALNEWILKETENTYSRPYKVIYVNLVEVELRTSIKIKTTDQNVDPRFVRGYGGVDS